MKRVVETTAGLTLRQAEVVDFVIEGGRVAGIVTEDGETIAAGAVVLTTGTFLEGLMHVGDRRCSGGRSGDRASHGLSAALTRLGLETGRLKTGTCPRLDSRTIDYDRLVRQPGDDPPTRFSFGPVADLLPQIACHITYTNSDTHRIIRDNIDQSPIYSGERVSRGPRYCPSIEDTVGKFPDRHQHRRFLEPEGLDTVEVYPNGLSTALPYDVQKRFVESIEGLERAVIVRPGYAIEYDYVVPTQLSSSLEARDIEGLYLGGQINGTTGYEEAAAQGFIAGVNASRRVRGMEPVVFGRDEAYIGVMIDDLVTRGVDGEPYRMFTSRAEFRLLLREDNADIRLLDRADEIGVRSAELCNATREKKAAVEVGIDRLERESVRPNETTNRALAEYGEAPLSSPTTAFDLLRRPGFDYAAVSRIADLSELAESVSSQIEIFAKYEGYIRRQKVEIERMRRLEHTLLPADLSYELVEGLSNEATEKLSRVRPQSLGQVARISGLTPSAVTALAVHLKKTGRV
jgi:tRNA uridine 5-carboxymethylaminomethyl modification enzyme